MSDEPVPTPPASETPPPLPAATPPPRPRRERLPGTYAGNYLDDDPDPAFGGMVTAGLFTVAFALEILRLFTEIFSAITIEADVLALLRVGLFSLGLIVLWAGGGAARWFLAVGAFVFGGGLLVNTMQLRRDAASNNLYALASFPLAFVYLASLPAWLFQPTSLLLPGVSVRWERRSP